MIHRVTFDKLQAAEAARWPGYAGWVVAQARLHGGAVADDHVVLPDALHRRLAAEVAERVGRTAVVPPRPSGPWSPLHLAVARLAPGPEASAAVDRFAASIPATTTNRRGQFVAHRARLPEPRTGTTAHLCQWASDLQNAVNHDLDHPRVPYATAAATWGWPPLWAADALHLHATATGLGDAVVAVYVACGLADATGRPVVYHANHYGWLTGVRHPGLTITDDRDGRQGVDVWGGLDGHNHDSEHAESRAAAWCDRAAAALGVPKFRPARPAVVEVGPRDRSVRPFALLSPFSRWRAREWPEARWAELAGQLLADGLAVHVIADGIYTDGTMVDGSYAWHEQGPRLPAVFGRVPGATWHVEPLRRARELVRNAAVAIGNDSGLAHYAGLIGTPCVSVHAGSHPHSFLYDMAPSVTSVTPGVPTGRGGADPGLLATVTADAVAAEVVRRRPRPRVAVVTLHTPAIRELGEFTAANKRAYCARHGYDFIGEADLLDAGRPPAWSKVLLLQRHLADYDWLMWTDADSAFTNPDRDLGWLTATEADMVIARDASGINTGVFLIRNTPAAAAFLSRVWDQADLIDHRWWEQAAMMRLLDSGGAGITVQYARKRSLNSYPGEDWQPGDLIMHTPARPDRLGLLRRALAGDVGG